MSKNFGIFGALSGALAVLAGAFGAHVLKQHLSASSLDVYQTAVLYQFFHAGALCVIGFGCAHLSARRWLAVSGWSMLLGMVLFSGSLYALALGAPRPIGLLTPLGGIGLLLGWLCFAGAVRVSR